MAHIEWTSDLDTGIQVIDNQHKRIVGYINKLDDTRVTHYQEQISIVLNELVDYTLSHFTFKESLMEEAGYEYLAVHQQTHEAFTRRISDLHKSFRDGNDVSDEISELLEIWLINHIMSDDQSYAPLVRQKFSIINNKTDGSWLTRTYHRFFG